MTTETKEQMNQRQAEELDALLQRHDEERNPIYKRQAEELAALYQRQREERRVETFNRSAIAKAEGEA